MFVSLKPTNNLHAKRELPFKSYLYLYSTPVKTTKFTKPFTLNELQQDHTVSKVLFVEKLMVFGSYEVFSIIYFI